jgi:hypothetical protein
MKENLLNKYVVSILQNQIWIDTYIYIYINNNNNNNNNNNSDNDYDNDDNDDNNNISNMKIMPKTTWTSKSFPGPRFHAAEAGVAGVEVTLGSPGHHVLVDLVPTSSSGHIQSSFGCGMIWNDVQFLSLSFWCFGVWWFPSLRDFS